MPVPLVIGHHVVDEEHRMRKAMRVTIVHVSRVRPQNLLIMPISVPLCLASSDYTVLLVEVRHGFPHLDHRCVRCVSSGR